MLDCAEYRASYRICRKACEKGSSRSPRPIPLSDTRRYEVWKGVQVPLPEAWPRTVDPYDDVGTSPDLGRDQQASHDLLYARCSGEVKLTVLVMVKVLGHPARGHTQRPPTWQGRCIAARGLSPSSAKLATGCWTSIRTVIDTCHSDITDLIENGLQQASAIKCCETESRAFAEHLAGACCRISPRTRARAADRAAHSCPDLIEHYNSNVRPFNSTAKETCDAHDFVASVNIIVYYYSKMPENF
ncbi:hypothetical protein ACJJTC_012678 [Scirpophaga incertulas]